MVVEVIDAPWARGPGKVPVAQYGAGYAANTPARSRPSLSRTTRCVLPGRVWVRGRSAGRSDSCASREPLSLAWPDNWQPRGIPCGPISSRVCKPHLMTLPVSQACGCWGLMRGVWHHQDRCRRGPRELTGIVDLTRGEDHPTARLLDLVPGRSGTAHENLVGRAWRRLPRGVRIATLDHFQGQ